MPKRATLTTQEYLIKASLPEATETYTVIPHGAVIERTKKALAAAGLEIKRELYRCNEGANVAQGIYHLNHGTDPDIGLLFAWSNSYDKSMKFKCSIGGYVHSSLAAIIGGNMGQFGRKHTGTADDETFDTIDNQIANAGQYFAELVADKEAMKTMPITEDKRAEFMGKLYFVNELLTGEQLGLTRDQFNKPSFSYAGVKDSLWEMYNGIIYSLQKAHPRTWMDQQRMIHYIVCKQFNVSLGLTAVAEQNSVNIGEPLTGPEAIVNQLNILDQIAEVEAISNGSPDKEMQVEEVKHVISMQELHQKSGDNFTIAVEAIKESFVLAEEIDWYCLDCGDGQGATAIFHDGQLCTKCANK